jgi:hypothetical protein
MRINFSRETSWRASWAVRLAGILFLLAAGLLYLATLDNGLQPEELVGGDLITHQYAQVQARPSNAPGYPLYTMGGWLWFHGLRTLWRWFGDAQPNPIPLLSSYSTLWALLALGLFYAILCRLTRTANWPSGNWPLAWLLSAFYAVTYFFWYYATTTEQYSSAIAQTLAIFYLYLRWIDTGDKRQEAGGERRETEHRRTRYLLLLAFLCGLSLAHMLTVALIVPALVVVVLWQEPTLLRSWRTVFSAVAAAFLPLVSYLYIYMRGAQHPEWWGVGQWESTTQWFWAFLSTAQGRQELSWGLAAGIGFGGVHFPELIWHELTWPLLLLGLLGIARLGQKLALILYPTLLIYLLFCWAYRYGNWYQVILPAYPLVLLGVAGFFHTQYKMQGGRSSTFRLPYSAFYGAALLLLGGLVIWRLVGGWPAANSHNRLEDRAFEQAANLLAQPLPQNAPIFAQVNDALALQYLINIWQVRPDLHVLSSPAAAEVLAQGKPVFVTWQAAELFQQELPAALKPMIQSATADWLRFQTTNQALTPAKPALLLERPITATLTLEGYTIRPTPPTIPAPITPTLGVDVVLFWRLAQGVWPAGLALSLRPTLQGAFLADPTSSTGGILQQDQPGPAPGLLRLPDGASNLVVNDNYRLRWPATVAKRVDGVLVIVYRKTESGFENIAEISLPIH